jgi:hypothetical protein
MYFATVSGIYGSFLTQADTLTNINCDAFIIRQPVSQTVCGGNFAVFTASTSGLGTFSYLWNTGDTTSSITTSTVGVYFATISGSYGNFLTNSATLSNINCNTFISQQPVSQTVCGGNFATFTVSANGVGPFTYLWNNMDTTRSITTSTPGVYFATVTGFYSSAITNGATLTGINCTVTDVLTNDFKPSIAIYPNPSNESFTIQSQEVYNYIIFDLQGNELESGLTSSTIIGARLPSGLFQLKVDERVYKVVKFVD